MPSCRCVDSAGRSGQVGNLKAGSTAVAPQSMTAGVEIAELRELRERAAELEELLTKCEAQGEGRE